MAMSTEAQDSMLDGDKPTLRERVGEIVRIVLALAYLAGSVACAWVITQTDIDGPARIALVVVPVLLSAIVAGLVTMQVRKLDERQRNIAYRALAMGGYALAGMMMGASMSSMLLAETVKRGFLIIPFSALPAMLTFAVLMGGYVAKRHCTNGDL